MSKYRLEIIFRDVLIAEEYDSINRLLHEAISISMNPSVISIRAEVVKGEFDEEKQLSGQDRAS